MLFNSYIFIFLFLPIVFVGYLALQRSRSHAVKMFLVAASLFFYGWWDLDYVPLILLSMSANFILGQFIQKSSIQPSQRLLLLWFGIGVNLAVLMYFKYAVFIVSNLSVFNVNLELAAIALPLAISFFTFQQIAYLVDGYKQEIKATNFLDYTLFVTFFPQLIAGPIVHHKQLIPQFSAVTQNIFNEENIARGLMIFSLGLFKKVVIADQFAVWANAGYNSTESLTFIEGWATSLSYTFQLYFDFSGYSDMAIGLALLFGIKLPLNFASPYKATSIQEFWRTWHITLSQFLRDYLYIPLGGNRAGEFRTMLNLMLTFLIGGLWHGASWMFVIWGALHGLAIVLHRMWQNLGYQLRPWLGWLCTFFYINLCWVFFRADDMSMALKVLEGMFDFSGLFVTMQLLTDGSLAMGILFHRINGNILTPACLTIGLLVCLYAPTSEQYCRVLTIKKGLITSILFLFALFMMLDHQAEFLYFNF